MSDAHALLEELGHRNVEVWLDAGQLRYRAPRGTMTPELRARLVVHKQAVMSLLGARTRDAANEQRSEEPFPLTELAHAYLLGHAAFAELGDLPAQIYLEFELPRLDVDRLARVAARLIARHDALRVVVLPDGGQRVARDPAPLVIAREDLTGRSGDELAAARLALRRRMSSGAVDPFRGPPLAVTAVRCDDGWIVLVAVSLLVLDGTSLRILLEEGTRLYADLDAALPALELSYRGYVEAIAHTRTTEAYQRALAHWRSRLSELPEAPELPLVGTTSARRDRFTRRTHRIAAATWRAFKDHARAAGLTPSNALCAAYASTIAAWSRHPRFLLNVMFLSRPPLHPDAARIVGNFASTCLLAVDVDPASGFAERAQRIQRQLLGDLEHAAVSGMTVARELNLAQHASPRPRAPVVFASALDPAGARRIGWLDRLSCGILHTPHVWLDHQAIEDGGTVVLNWDAVEELFPAGLLDDAFAAYVGLVDRLAGSAGAWHDVPQLTPEPHRRLVRDANATACALAPETLPELVARAAAAAPDAIAVIGDGRRLTYRELVVEASAIAGWLRDAGVRPGGLVAVVMEKGWEQVVAVLAIAMAGAAYLPIDPALPAERIRFLLARCEPARALTQRRIDAGVSWPEAFIRHCVDGPLPAPAVAAATAPRPDDLAYVIFTSGSTGTPKGVMISHRGAVNTILDVNRRFAVCPDDRVLALSSLSFDLSVYDVFGLLAAGGAIVFPAAAAARDPAAWRALIERERVTVWNSVPALAQLLVEHLEASGERLARGPRLVLLSGDWIPVRLPDALRAHAPGAEVVSLGGATEASIWSILHPTDAIAEDAQSIPYGKAMANQQMLVLDDALEPRPVWVPGELYIGGTGVADGYFRDPERTAARFIVHPRTGERLYRTGDIARLLRDGALEFLGREDGQVKVQGFRIELGEIERALAAAPGVRGCVVTAVGERRGAKTLAAYVTGEAAPEPAELRRFLAERLPGYMVPARFVLVDRFPLTANGKLDRGALERTAKPEPAGFVAPRDPLEVELAALFGELLGAPRVGVHDDFFALGGHSLLAVRLAARVRARFGRELPLAGLLAHPTVAGQAEVLRGGGSGALPRQVACLAPGDGTPIFLIHPVGGNAICYRELAGLLRAHGPVFGIQADDAADAPATLHELARGYVEVIRAVQPHGPYRLGGWSLGGFIAVELAGLLGAPGDPIELVFTIDSCLPIAGAAASSRPELLARFLGDLQHGAVGEPGALALRLTAAGPDGCLADAHRWALDAGLLPGELSIDAFARMFRVFERNARALLGHRPRAASPCDLAVHAFCAASVLVGHDAAGAWTAERDILHPVAGDHYSVMQPPVLHHIAERVGDALAREVRS